MDRTRKAIKADEEFTSAYAACLHLMQGQSNEHIKNFAFWPEPTAREGDNIYDVRTYFLKAGESREIAYGVRTARPTTLSPGSPPPQGPCTTGATTGSRGLRSAPRSGRTYRGEDSLARLDT